MTTTRSLLLVVISLGLGACQKPPPEPPRATPALAALAPTAAHPAAPHPAAPRPGGLSGAVVERLDAPGYTYLKIKGPAGETWAAVPTTAVAVGAQVTITNPSPMQNFESKTLGRTFDLVMFGSSAEVAGAGAAAGAGAPAAPGHAAMPVGDPHAGQALPAPAAVDVSNIKVAKATGPDARTVAEVWAQREALKDKSVTVRGKVVKATGGVLGRNWLHLRDGTGTAAAQDNDLVVTTTAEAKPGDEVTAQGTVRADRTLGAGYTFKVLVEDAQLKP